MRERDRVGNIVVSNAQREKCIRIKVGGGGGCCHASLEAGRTLSFLFPSSSLLPTHYNPRRLFRSIFPSTLLLVLVIDL